MSEQEMWRSVVGFEGRYEVSSFGRMRGVGPRGRGIRKPYITWQGYHEYCLYVRRKKTRNLLVHCIVAEAFIGPRPHGLLCCHNDGNPGNNHLSNLRYDLPKENSADMIRHGMSLLGSRNPASKLNENIVAEIIRHRAQTGDIYSVIARKFGISKSTIQCIFSGEKWKHVGFDVASDIGHKTTNKSKKGERGCAKLKERDVRAIRAEYAERRPTDSGTARDLATRYGVHQSSITSICNGTSWSHVPRPTPQDLQAPTRTSRAKSQDKIKSKALA